jgi:uncharacterized RDD family membrane protein YckC
MPEPRAAAGGPAGFWKRYVAYSLDALPLAALAAALDWPRLAAAAARCAAAARAMAEATASTLVAALANGGDPVRLATGLLQAPALREAITGFSAALQAWVGPFALAYALCSMPYHALLEASRWQGSPGKRLLGLRVTDRAGAPPSLPRSLARNAGGALSWLSLNLGHALAALPPDKRALHDYLAGTRVLARAPGPLPGWARAWLAAQGIAVAWLCVAAGTWWARALDAALLRALG